MFFSMKKAALRPFRSQHGQVMIIALILIALVSLMIPPLMGFMSSGLKQGTALENRTNQLYIADAGIESACQTILAGKLNDRDEDGNWTFTDANGNPQSIWQYTVYDVNEPSSSASVTITLLAGTTEGQDYSIVSTGTDSKGGSTQIEAKIRAEIGQYFSFLNNIGTTDGIFNVQGSGKVTIDGIIQSSNPDINATFESGGWGGVYGGVWPEETLLENYYGAQIAPDNPTAVPPYDNPNYFPSGWTIDTETTLTESVYVVGDCEINADLTLGTNVALFVDGSIKSDPKAVVTGPGVIAATENILLFPKNYSGNPGEGLFVFCLGNLELKPSNTFYGWAIGRESIHIYQGTGPDFNWVDPNDPYVLNILNFPGLLSPGPSFPTGRVAILNWNVTNQ